MKLKRILEEKTISALNLAKASGKLKVGLGVARRALDTDNLKILLIASDVEKKQRVDRFRLPEKDQFSKSEVESLLKRYNRHLKRKKKKKVIDIKKELALLKILAEEKKILILEGLSKKRLGRAVGIPTGTACISILNPGRAKNIFESIKAENR